MPIKIEIRPLATIEILEAYDWYELMKEGLGDDFLKELDIFFYGLHQNPNTYTFYDKPVREGKLKRFPYQVVYEFYDTISTIVVYSVFMAKQDPEKKRII